MSLNFKTKNITQSLANFLRSDKFFSAKNVTDSKLRKLLIGLALEIGRAEGKFQEISDEYDITKTSLLLEQWESALGIPDECFPVSSTNDQRRKNIQLKLTALGVSTKEGFEALAETLGFSVEVLPGNDALTFPYTFPFIMTDVNSKWIMVVNAPASQATSTFPYIFPFNFGIDSTQILQCLFSKLAPAPVQVLFNFV